MATLFRMPGVSADADEAVLEAWTVAAGRPSPAGRRSPRWRPRRPSSTWNPTSTRSCTRCWWRTARPSRSATRSPCSGDRRGPEGEKMLAPIGSGRRRGVRDAGTRSGRAAGPRTPRRRPEVPAGRAPTVAAGHRVRPGAAGTAAGCSPARSPGIWPGRRASTSPPRRLRPRWAASRGRRAGRPTRPRRRPPRPPRRRRPASGGPRSRPRSSGRVGGGAAQPAAQAGRLPAAGVQTAGPALLPARLAAGGALLALRAQLDAAGTADLGERLLRQGRGQGADRRARDERLLVRGAVLQAPAGRHGRGRGQRPRPGHPGDQRDREPFSHAFPRSRMRWGGRTTASCSSPNWRAAR